MTTARIKRIIFYAYPEDRAHIARIKDAKPHWSYNTIIREALATLANTFPKLPPQLDEYPPSDEYPPIQEKTRVIK
jgi:hypothetical protein